MKLTEQQYNHLMSNVNLPLHLKKELTNTVHKESWTFVGT